MVSQKEAEKFMKSLRDSRKKYTKILNPRFCYTSDYDIFSMVWGDRKIESTIELNLLHQGDLRFDLDKDGTIVGLEIEDFSNVLKKFDCDKKKKIKKKIKKNK